MPEVWLETPRTVTTTVTTSAYVWWNADKWVPEGAKSLIFSAECSKSGGGNSVLEVRADPRLPGQKVFNTGTGLSSVPRFSLTLDPRTRRRAFQFRVTGASFGTSLSLTLIGYEK